MGEIIPVVYVLCEECTDVKPVQKNRPVKTFEPLRCGEKGHINVNLAYLHKTGGVALFAVEFEWV